MSKKFAKIYLLVVLSLIFILLIFNFLFDRYGAFWQRQSLVGDNREISQEATSGPSLEEEIIYPDYIENPEPAGFVTDLANLIPENKEMEIVKMLEDYEKKTTNEIVVLTVRSIGDETIDFYANRIFNKWGIGLADKNNGILILLTTGAARIEVGYGLENTLTKEITDEILHKNFFPFFKPGDYSEGIIEGIKALTERIEI